MWGASVSEQKFRKFLSPISSCMCNSHCFQQTSILPFDFAVSLRSKWGWISCVDVLCHCPVSFKFVWRKLRTVISFYWQRDSVSGEHSFQTTNHLIGCHWFGNCYFEESAKVANAGLLVDNHLLEEVPAKLLPGLAMAVWVIPFFLLVQVQMTCQVGTHRFSACWSILGRHHTLVRILCLVLIIPWLAWDRAP